MADLSKLSNGNFRRVLGITRKVFDTMVQAIKEAKLGRKTKRGNQPSFTEEEQVCMLLEYYREYPTMLQMSTRWKGVHEATISRNIAKTETILIKNNLFHLPKEKLKDAETIVIDVTEIQIDRPKKNKNSVTQVKRKNIPSKLK
jgi:hypothetical protein